MKARISKQQAITILLYFLATLFPFSGLVIAQEKSSIICDNPFQHEGVTCNRSEMSEFPRDISWERIWADFNNDGLMDVAINVPESCGATGNCGWSIWLRLESGQFKYLKGISTGMFSLIPGLAKGEATLLALSHISADESGFNRYLVKGETITLKQAMSIEWADTGDEEIEKVKDAVDKYSLDKNSEWCRCVNSKIVWLKRLTSRDFGSEIWYEEDRKHNNIMVHLRIINRSTQIKKALASKISYYLAGGQRENGGETFLIPEGIKPYTTYAIDHKIQLEKGEYAYEISPGGLTEVAEDSNYLVQDNQASGIKTICWYEVDNETHKVKVHFQITNNNSEPFGPTVLNVLSFDKDGFVVENFKYKRRIKIKAHETISVNQEFSSLNSEKIDYIYGLFGSKKNMPGHMEVDFPDP